MRLFGPLHLTLLFAIALACAVLSYGCRRGLVNRRATRLAIGWGLVVNELIWWGFRYSHEGLHLWNLPFQLCDVTLWMSALACLTLSAPVVEFAYFGGLAGAGMAQSDVSFFLQRRAAPYLPSVCLPLAHRSVVRLL